MRAVAEDSALICKIEELTAELKSANSLKEQELIQSRNGLWASEEEIAK